MAITFGDHLIDSGYYDITPEQEREIEESEQAIHVDAIEVREDILDHQVELCPHDGAGLESGFGLGGGGFGPYGFCPQCNRIIWKISLGDDAS